MEVQEGPVGISVYCFPTKLKIMSRPFRKCILYQYVYFGQIWISQLDMYRYRPNAIDLQPHRNTLILRNPTINVIAVPKINIIVEKIFYIISLIGGI